MHLIDDEERRRRLVTRHGLASEHRAGGVDEAVRQVVVLHATEPATVHLSVAARAPLVTVADVEQSLYGDRSLVKQLAMRRTLFGFPRDLLPAALGSASARVAGQQERLIAKDIERHGVARDGSAWLARAQEVVLERLADGSALSARRLREDLPDLQGRTRAVEGKNYGGAQAFAPRVLTLLGARGLLVRARNEGHWRTSRPLWASAEAWLGEVPEHWSEQAGYAELVRRWLARFGPGTEADLVWWLGSTKAAVRRALVDVGAVEVRLDSDAAGWVLPGDEGPTPAVAPTAALLPVLDPSTMGWRGREFYLRPDDAPYLFDSQGNGGTTAWWDGRIVGAWVQADQQVRILLRADVGAEARAALDAEAERLADFLGDVVIASVYKSRMMKGETLP